MKISLNRINWKHAARVIFFVLGIIIVGLGSAVRRRGTRQPQTRPRKGEFVESIPAARMPYDAEVRNDIHDHPHAV